MNNQLPDQVPLMCQFSFGFMNRQLKNSGITPMEFWLDAEKYGEGLMILRERFKFDGILVSVHGHSENWKEKIKTIHSIEINNNQYLLDQFELSNEFSPNVPIEEITL